MNAQNAAAGAEEVIKSTDMHVTIGDRLIPRDYDSYKSLYPVSVDGDLRAFIGVEQGWGKPWKLYPLTPDDRARLDGVREIHIRGATLTFYGTGKANAFAHFKTEILANLECFPTAAFVKQKAVEIAAESARLLARGEEARRVRRAQKAADLHQLREIMKRNTLDVDQRDALQRVIDQMASEVTAVAASSAGR